MYTRAGIIADKHCDEVVLDSCKIASRYLKTWFLLDLISSLPLDYTILLFSPETNVRQLVRAGNRLHAFILSTHLLTIDFY